MLNREDIRKVLEAHKRVIDTFKYNEKDLDDISMRELHEAILKDIQLQENTDKTKE